MIIVKRQKPEFYDCRCDKCQAEFLYQLDDIKEKELELPEIDNPVIGMIMPETKKYIVCPCCGNELVVGFPNPYYGLGLSNKI